MTYRVLVISDAHFFNPQYFQYVVQKGHDQVPSRLSTDTALGDRKANPFHALILLARNGKVDADALVCCGDLTTCADPTAMNLGWLQLHRLATALKAGEPVVTAGNHDLDSRFKTSVSTPQRILRYLDPPFPTADQAASASYWANGYCILDRAPDVRVVLVNSCSLHGYATETDRQLDHGFVPEEVFTLLPEELAKKQPAPINILVCHHHPVEIDLPEEDKSVISNGGELVALLNSLSPGWLVLHGHRHLPSIQYAGPGANAPVVFSAGSLSANLHLRLQGRASNQFYRLELEAGTTGLRGRYEAWTWDQHEGEWIKGQDTPALPSLGGFGYRPDPIAAAASIANLVPPYASGVITWRSIEDQQPELKFLLPHQRKAILDALSSSHSIDWESDSHRVEVDSRLLRIGRRA